MLRLASDVDVQGAVIRGLRRRMPDIELVRTQDILGQAATDADILSWAAGENRVV